VAQLISLGLPVIPKTVDEEPAWPLISSASTWKATRQ
jgi:hypothetical protein